MTPDQIDIVRRALALRRLKKIGILFADHGKLFISDNPVDPWGTKIVLSFEALEILVDDAERPMRLPIQGETLDRNKKQA